LYVGLVISAAEVARRKFHIPTFYLRGLVHVSIANWVFPTFWLFRSLWAALIPPIGGILLNLTCWRTGLLSFMEEKGKGYLGTVLYPISFALLLALFWESGRRYAAGAGVLIMGWGDPLAYFVGSRWGRHRYKVWGGAKSLEGTGAMFGCAFIIVLTVFLVTRHSLLHSLLASLAVAAAASVAEAVGSKGYDNLTVPIVTAASCYYLA